MTTMDAGNGGALKLTEDMQAAISGTEHALHRAGIEPGSLSAQSAIFLAGYRMGQRDMRERAAHGLDVLRIGISVMGGSEIDEAVEQTREQCAAAIRALPVEE